MSTYQSEDLKSFWAAIHIRGQEFIEKLESREAELEAEKKQLEAERKQLEADKALLREKDENIAYIGSHLEEDKCRMKRAGIGESDLISLNFGGEHVVTVKRSLLIQFPDSMRASMFSGRYEDQLDRDKHGNVFFDYSPKIMMTLIEYFRFCRDSSPEAVPLPVLEESLQQAWHAMARFFDLSNLSPATFYGIKQNVKISDITGWSMLPCKPYAHKATMDDVVPPNGQDGVTLLIAARKAGSETLAVAAMGRADFVTKASDELETHFHNGTHWYCCRGTAFGFVAPYASIFRDPGLRRLCLAES